MLASLAEKEDMRGRFLFFSWKRAFGVPDLKAWFKSTQTSQNWKLNEAELKRVLGPAAQSKKPFCNNIPFPLNATNWFVLGVFMFPEANILNVAALKEVGMFLCIERFN